MILRRLLMVSFLLLSFLLTAQNTTRIDSLTLELEGSDSPLRTAELSSYLWAATIDSDIDQALGYAEQIIRIGKKLEVDTILSSGYQKKGIGYAYLSDFDSSGIYFRRALRLYRKEGDYEKMASILRNLGQDHNMIGNLDSASFYYQQAGENFAKINDSVGMADIYNSEAIVYYIKGYYNLAFDKAVTGEKIFAKSADLAMDLNQNRMVIAAIYSAMKDTSNAITYFQKITDFFKANDAKRQYVSNGVLLADLLIPNYQQYPQLEALVNEIVTESKALQDPTLINNVLLTKAAYEYQKGNYAEARNVQAAVISSTTNEGEEYLQALGNLALGKTLLASQAYARAVDHLRTAEKLTIQLDMETLLRDVKKLLAEAYEALGNYQSSLTHFKAYKSLDEKIYNEERSNRFAELQTIYEIEKKESALALQEETIKTLNAEAKTSKLTKTLYASGMGSFVLISGLLYFGFRQRLKKNKLEREKQEAIYQQALAFKQKELASQTLHLVQKNTFIQELKENLEKIKQSPELFKVEFRKLILLLRRQSGEDKNWEVFKSYFSEVHNNFDNHLRAVAPDITENDIRLASFLRMNLTTNEIASLQNVLPESVLKSKYRLKKKLGLPKEQDLSTFVNSL